MPGPRLRIEVPMSRAAVAVILALLVAPFSARPAHGAPVSIPIHWDELDDPDLAPDRWTIRTAVARAAEAGDPLRDLVDDPQVLPELG